MFEAAKPPTSTATTNSGARHVREFYRFEHRNHATTSCAKEREFRSASRAHESVGGRVLDTLVDDYDPRPRLPAPASVRPRRRPRRPPPDVGSPADPRPRKILCLWGNAVAVSRTSGGCRFSSASYKTELFAETPTGSTLASLTPMCYGRGPAFQRAPVVGARRYPTKCQDICQDGLYMSATTPLRRAPQRATTPEGRHAARCSLGARVNNYHLFESEGPDPDRAQTVLGDLWRSTCAGHALVGRSLIGPARAPESKDRMEIAIETGTRPLPLLD